MGRHHHGHLPAPVVGGVVSAIRGFLRLRLGPGRAVEVVGVIPVSSSLITGVMSVTTHRHSTGDIPRHSCLTGSAAIIIGALYPNTASAFTAPPVCPAMIRHIRYASVWCLTETLDRYVARPSIYWWRGRAILAGETTSPRYAISGTATTSLIAYPAMKARLGFTLNLHLFTNSIGRCGRTVCTRDIIRYRRFTPHGRF